MLIYMFGYEDMPWQEQLLATKEAQMFECLTMRKHRGFLSATVGFLCFIMQYYLRLLNASCLLVHVLISWKWSKIDTSLQERYVLSNDVNFHDLV